MKNVYPRLLKLRAELEQSYASPDNGLSVLYAIRRELLRHCQSVSYQQLLAYPSVLHQRFDLLLYELRKAPAFPSLSDEAQYTHTEQTLIILEQVVQCLQLAPTVVRS
jgi:hypothetical protein